MYLTYSREMKFALLAALFVAVFEHSSCYVQTLPNHASVADLNCDPADEYLAPHPDCTKYYLCSGGVLFLRTCPGNLYFSPELEQCSFKHEVPECIGGTRPPIEPTAEPVTTTTVVPVETTTQGNELSCPADDNGELNYYPHPESYSLFFMCNDGELGGVYDCGTGYWFDSVTQACVRPENSDCKLELTTKPPTTTTTVVPVKTTTQGYEFSCPADGNGVLNYYPHPESCGLFLRCRNGEFGGVYDCAAHYWFDSASERCVEPENSDCKIGLTTEPSMTTTTVVPVKPTTEGNELSCPANNAGEPRFGLFPHPHSCSLLLICYEGELGGVFDCGTGYYTGSISNPSAVSSQILLTVSLDHAIEI